jgi:predicted esterase
MVHWVKYKSITLAIFVFIGLSAYSLAQGVSIAPYKDDLFSYGKILQQSSDGNFKVVDYEELRDVNTRDQVPTRKVKSKYVTSSVKWHQSRKTYKSSGKKHKYYAVYKGKANAIRQMVIYIHGKGGNFKQGGNDWTFGGNFNRIKNLMVKSRGAYFSVDFSDFGKQGKNDIITFIKLQRQKMPRAKVILSCGSTGGFLCWSVAKDKRGNGFLDGLVLMGSTWDESYINAYKRFGKKIPIMIGHGTRDTIYNYKNQLAFYELLRNKGRNYPVQLTLFKNGIHGTPIRMLDWRESLNWILAHQ